MYENECSEAAYQPMRNNTFYYHVSPEVCPFCSLSLSLL